MDRVGLDQTGSSLRLRLDAKAPSVGVARHAAADFAERAGADPGAVALAVSEAVSNAVLHAYVDRAPGTVDLSADRNGEGIVVTVHDDGRGISPHPGGPGLGYGLALVAQLADEIGITTPSGGGTTIRMRFASTA